VTSARSWFWLPRTVWPIVYRQGRSGSNPPSNGCPFSFFSPFLFDDAVSVRRLSRNVKPRKCHLWRRAKKNSRLVQIHIIQMRVNAHRRISRRSSASLMGCPAFPPRAAHLAFEQCSFPPSRHCPFPRLKRNRKPSPFSCLAHARLKQAYRYIPRVFSLRGIPLQGTTASPPSRPTTAPSTYSQLPNLPGILTPARVFLTFRHDASTCLTPSTQQPCFLLLIRHLPPGRQTRQLPTGGSTLKFFAKMWQATRVPRTTRSN